MKKRHIKGISATLMAALFISLNSLSLAAFTMDLPSEGEIFLKHDGHGQYSIATSVRRGNLTSYSTNQSTGDVVVATATANEDLYSLSGDDYALRVCSQGTNQLFLLVEEHTLNLNSYSKEDLNQFNYPEEMLNRIDGLIQSQLSGGNEDFGVSVYMPKEIRSDVSTLGSTTYHTTTYTSNGRQYTDSYTFFNNFSCDYSKSGTDAYNKARSFVSFLVECAGVPSKTISAFQFGYSATKTLANLLGISESAVGNGYSKIQTIVTYDATYKLTYWNNGNTGSEPYVGTCRAWLNTNATQQTADCIPAGVQQTSVYLNETIESPHFSNPSGWLYDDYYSAAFVIEGPIYYTIIDKEYTLV